jgi:hypothetical protein
MRASKEGEVMNGATCMMSMVRRAALLAVLLPSVSGCGGGRDEGPSYALSIDGAAQRSATTDSVVLTGNGFLPPGSTCSGECSGLLPPPVFGQLGGYQLVWTNAATGESGSTGLHWVCNCGGAAPYWIQAVPLAAGDNLITFTQTAGSLRQQAAITVTRI